MKFTRLWLGLYLACLLSGCAVSGISHLPGGQIATRSPQLQAGPGTCEQDPTCDPAAPPQGAPPPPGAGGGGTGGATPVPRVPPNKSCSSTNPSNAAANTKARDAAASNAIAATVRANPSLITSSQMQEAYGYVYSNGAGAFSWDSFGIVALNSSEQATILPPNSYPGWTAVGIWHTHPIGANGVADNGTVFSDADIATVTGSIVSMYVGEEATTATSTDNLQELWFAYSPASNESGKPGTGQSIGTGGC